ncbi:AraC family transcriptional regulator [Brevibacterium sanguinis]|uniref:AraC family transcriptional regulator n=2 Tax=Brevibacterium TaxID=1696 RepID=A0A366IGG2_9MICO|nr:MULTISPECIES: helix-turn-helix domain-containing protein [Brevibacterium]RBP62246.1 AraC family transcriptional regulator [Brevibacterium sanguinis]RBP70622.1 AraC family transcriptional regulator [Brevibacterium celere]
MDLIVLDAEVVVAGADSTARVVRGARGPAVGLRFDPGVLPQLLATSAAELANTLTPLDAVAAGTPVASRCRVERGFETGGPAPDPGPDARRLLGIAAALAEVTELDPRPMALASTLARGTPIAEAAAQFAYSPRQLRRLAADWYGYGPKHLAKILRWQAARGLIAGGSTRTAAAAALGYSDAAHLWRDEKALLDR